MLADRVRRKELLQRWERFTQFPLLIFAAAMIPLLIIPLVVDLSASTEELFFTLDLFIWAAFAFDLAVRVTLADNRPRYLLTHWYDVVIVAVPWFRPLRVVRVLLFSTRAVIAARKALNIQFVLLFGISMVLGSALLGFAFEHGTDGANIKTFQDGLWWAMTTITTVGYGDRFPITPEGRMVGAILMVGGITFFGAMTANLSAFLVSTGKSLEMTPPPPSIPTLEAKLDELSRKIDRLEQALNEKNNA